MFFVGQLGVAQFVLCQASAVKRQALRLHVKRWPGPGQAFRFMHGFGCLSRQLQITTARFRHCECALMC